MTARALAALLLALVLPACARQGLGDFGRRADDHNRRFEDPVLAQALPVTGSIAAMVRGEPVSLYPLTDDEKELRDRAWRFLTPAHDAQHLQRWLAELSVTRVLPPLDHSGENHYHLALMSGPFRSMASRYAKLAEDVAAERMLLHAFLGVVQRVCAADRWRLQALDHAQYVSPIQRSQAESRVWENAMLAQWVRRDRGLRAAAYRYALEHLVIEGPQKQAIAVERALIALEDDLRALDRLGPCGTHEGPVAPPGPAGSPPSWHPASPAPVAAPAARPPK